MDGKSKDITADNIEKLKQLFPEAFTEGKVDFDALKEVLGTFVDDRDERYSFTWNGKSKARMIAQTPSTGTLRPCKEESVDWDTTQNIFIEGDNLEVLKLLQKSYHKKVKMIYIDPPYNTGKDFVYKDNFKDNIKNYKEITGQVDGEGRNLSNNPETSGRYHTDWLNMMYPRLKLARNLLKDDGVIFISIDNSEHENLTKICHEIFGEENFLGVVCRATGQTTGQDSGGLGSSFDFLLSYSKNPEIDLSGLPLTPKDIKRFDNKDERGKFAFDQMRKTGSNDRRQDRPNMYYPVKDPDGNDVYPIGPSGYESCWRFERKTYDRLLEEDYILWKKTKKNGNEVWWPYVKYYLEGRTKRPSPLWNDLDGNKKAARDLRTIFNGKKFFDFPKPVQMIERCIQIVPNSSKEDLIMDFFAGSGTTAHAVMSLNKTNGGNRKFIIIQLPEEIESSLEAFKAGYKTIAEISKERIRRAAAKIKEELTAKDTKKEGEDLFAEDDKENFRDFRGSNLPDLGFKVFKLDSTNIKPWEVDFDLTERTLEDFISNIKTDRREEDVLYEILLKYGLDLTLPITEHAIAGQKVFDIGMGAMIICLSDAISLEVVEGIAKLKDELNPEIMRVVFKDSGFKDDVVKTNAVQILKQAGIVDVRSL